jgi:hypothetical protein
MKGMQGGKSVLGVAVARGELGELTGPSLTRLTRLSPVVIYGSFWLALDETNGSSWLSLDETNGSSWLTSGLMTNNSVNM